jgi:tRNA(Ile)-lysidine synthase
VREKIERLFLSKRGKAIYKAICDTVKKEEMEKYIEKGVLVGLSGGADSVFLLSFLYFYKKTHPDFSLLAFHVNHMIREGEAERDLEFSKCFADALGIEFCSVALNVPLISKNNHKGLEETAREERYKAFSKIISSRNDLSTIAVAHNSTDNAETMVFNFIRGSGIRGLSGISPVRDNIIRPLLRISKEEIVNALSEFEIPFVFDSTNSDTDYTRNFIRHKILPEFQKINPASEKSMLRLSDTLRSYDDYFKSETKRFLDENLIDGYISRKALTNLHPAMRNEVLRAIFQKYSVNLEHTHIEKISNLLQGSNFSYDVPMGYSFISEEGRCAVLKKSEKNSCDFDFSLDLKLGVNKIPGISGAIILSREKLTETYLNVYKIAIQEVFDFDIINNGLCVRSKRDGDSYRYGNMTHKLKKIFNERNIPLSKRGLVPIICTDDGPVWPIGFPKRDGAVVTDEQNTLYIALAYDNCENANKSFYFKQNKISKTKGS